MEINKDFREFIESLNDHNVRYLIIGGFAVNFFGYPRYTKDIDFWIWLNKKNLGNLIKAIKDFGFDSLELKLEDFSKPDNIIQLGYEPYRIDILVDVNGLDFKDCYKRKTEIELDKIRLDFLSLEDLIIVKKKTGRLQDLADAEKLEKIREFDSQNEKK